MMAWALIWFTGLAMVNVVEFETEVLCERAITELVGEPYRVDQLSLACVQVREVER